MYEEEKIQGQGNRLRELWRELQRLTDRAAGKAHAAAPGEFRDAMRALHLLRRSCRPALVLRKGDKDRTPHLQWTVLMGDWRLSVWLLLVLFALRVLEWTFGRREIIGFVDGLLMSSLVLKVAVVVWVSLMFLACALRSRTRFGDWCRKIPVKWSMGHLLVNTTEIEAIRKALLRHRTDYSTAIASMIDAAVPAGESSIRLRHRAYPDEAWQRPIILNTNKAKSLLGRVPPAPQTQATARNSVVRCVRRLLYRPYRDIRWAGGCLHPKRWQRHFQDQDTDNAGLTHQVFEISKAVRTVNLLATLFLPLYAARWFPDHLIYQLSIPFYALAVLILFGIAGSVAAALTSPLHLPSAPINKAIACLLASGVIFVVTYAILLQKVGVVDGHSGWHTKQISTVLYFSLISWTTVGYGDFYPSPQAQPIVAVEALSGFLLLAVWIAAARWDAAGLGRRVRITTHVKTATRLRFLSTWALILAVAWSAICAACIKRGPLDEPARWQIVLLESEPDASRVSIDLILGIDRGFHSSKATVWDDPDILIAPSLQKLATRAVAQQPVSRLREQLKKQEQEQKREHRDEDGEWEYYFYRNRMFWEKKKHGGIVLLPRSDVNDGLFRTLCDTWESIGHRIGMVVGLQYSREIGDSATGVMASADYPLGILATTPGVFPGGLRSSDVYRLLRSERADWLLLESHLAEMLPVGPNDPSLRLLVVLEEDHQEYCAYYASCVRRLVAAKPTSIKVDWLTVGPYTSKTVLSEAMRQADVVLSVTTNGPSLSVAEVLVDLATVESGGTVANEGTPKEATLKKQDDGESSTPGDVEVVPEILFASASYNRGFFESLSSWRDTDRELLARKACIVKKVPGVDGDHVNLGRAILDLLCTNRRKPRQRIEGYANSTCPEDDGILERIGARLWAPRLDPLAVGGAGADGKGGCATDPTAVKDHGKRD